MEPGLLDEPIWECWARWYWGWRWRRHLAWLHAHCVRTQERAFSQPWGGEPGGCPRRPPPRSSGARLMLNMRDLERIEADMRHLVHYS
jgi:hypothetical protein